MNRRPARRRPALPAPPTGFRGGLPRLLPVLGLLAALGSMAGCSGTATKPSASQPAQTVTMTNNLTFEPARVTIEKGQTVRWENTSDFVHTVTDDPSKASQPDSALLPDGAKPWNSGNIAPGVSFQHTFTVPGTYRYFCIPHESNQMRGTVIVR